MKLNRETQIGLNLCSQSIKFAMYQYGLTEKMERDPFGELVYLTKPLGLHVGLMELILNPNQRLVDKFASERKAKYREDEDVLFKLLFRYPKNKNYYFTDNAIALTEDQELIADITQTFLHEIPDNTMETFLLGDSCYRYWKSAKLLRILYLKKWRSVTDLNLAVNSEKAVYDYWIDKCGSEEAVDKYMREGNQVGESLLIATVNLEKEEIEFDEQFDDIVQSFLRLLIFVRFANVQFTLVKGNTTSTHSTSDKVRNEMNADITIVKKNWNTISVRSEAFSVRGHFRSQPCGEGRLQRRRIFIKEFKKDGYVRKGEGVKDHSI